MPDDGMQADFNGTSVVAITRSDNTFNAYSITTGFDEAIEVNLLSGGATNITFSGNTILDAGYSLGEHGLDIENDGAGVLSVVGFDVADGGPLNVLNTFLAGGPVEETDGDVLSRSEPCPMP